ncbi:MAG: caspase family protein [Ferruginibacter sp.]
MAKKTAVSFSNMLENFKEVQQKAFLAGHPKLILIIMASTQDKELAAGCVKDVKNIKKVFKKIAAHSGFKYCEIEISGENYHGENLMPVINNLESMEIDVTVFYFSGHGFCYADDNSRKFPQLDMRHPSDTTEYDKMSFIRKHTKNLHEMLQLIRLRGGRINIAIGDCCSTVVHHKRSSKSKFNLEVVEDLMSPKEKLLSKKVVTAEDNYIDIVVSAARPGQAAVTDVKNGSLFTQNFTAALSAAIDKRPKGEKYLPFHQLLQKAASLANKAAAAYDVGEGKPGQQMASFEIYMENVQY